MQELGNIIVTLDMLRPHPRNEEHYGVAVADDVMVTSIKERGVIQKPVITQIDQGEEYYIVSGHRRVDGARKAGIKILSCELVKYDSDEECYYDLLSSNSQRIKSLHEIVKEILALKKLRKQIGCQTEENGDLTNISGDKLANGTENEPCGEYSPVREKEHHSNRELARLSGIDRYLVTSIITVFDDTYRDEFFAAAREKHGKKFSKKSEADLLACWQSLREEVLSGECSVHQAYKSVRGLNQEIAGKPKKEKPAKPKKEKVEVEDSGETVSEFTHSTMEPIEFENCFELLLDFKDQTNSAWGVAREFNSDIESIFLVRADGLYAVVNTESILSALRV